MPSLLSLFVLFISLALVLSQPPPEQDYCDPCGADAEYAETLSFDNKLLKRTIKSNGCPNHYSYCTGKEGLPGCGGYGVEGTASEAVVQTKEIEIPAKPVIATKTTDLECALGPIAIALNGVSIFSGAVDQQCTLVDVNDYTSEWISFDMCSGHSEQTGDYHYHFPPSCLLDQANSTNPFANGHSPQLGWSYDGFPIYGPYGLNGVLMTFTSNGCTGDYCLDDCSGQEKELPGVDLFKYRYYMTGNTSDLTSIPTDPTPTNNYYPYSLGCYVGCTWEDLSSGSCQGTSGVSEDYYPTLMTGYTEKFDNYSGTDKKCESGYVAPVLEDNSEKSHTVSVN